MGSPKINGGTYVIYEHASRLKKKGHRVILVTQQLVTSEEYAWHSSARELDWLTLDQAKGESFDMLLATWWQSPFLLHELQSTHYAYFVQSIESRFFKKSDPSNYLTKDIGILQQLCEKTYSYALPVITEATWIQGYLYKYYNNSSFLVRNGIRKDIYRQEGEVIAPREEGKFRVLVEGPVDVGYKNVPTSIRLAKEAGADEIWLLTSSDIAVYDSVDRVFSQVAIHETPAVYRSCDLLLKLSYVEGMFGPPLEMFHCGGTALVYDVTGHDEYIVHEENSYVVARDDEQSVVRLVQHLKEHPKELARLKQGAIQTAASWLDWEISSEQFEQALLEICAGKPVSRQYLKRYSDELSNMTDSLFDKKAYNIFVERERAEQEARETDKNNFVEFYWDGNGAFNKDNSQEMYYPAEEWTTVSFTVQIEEIPLWLRIDPSMRIGLIIIDSLIVYNMTRQAEIMSFQEPNDFQDLFLTGDLKWLFPERKNILFSYGQDPMFYLPAVEQDQASIGDLIEITLRLKETGVQHFFAENQVCFAETEKVPRSWWKRLLSVRSGKV